MTLSELDGDLHTRARLHQPSIALVRLLKSQSNSVLGSQLAHFHLRFDLTTLNSMSAAFQLSCARKIPSRPARRVYTWSHAAVQVKTTCTSYGIAKMDYQTTDTMPHILLQ